MCMNSKRRPVHLPQHLHCQSSLYKAVHLISVIYHVFPPFQTTLTMAEVTFPAAHLHIYTCNCPLDFHSPCFLVIQTSLHNPVADLNFGELKACPCLSSWPNSAFAQLFKCVYFIIVFLCKTFHA